MTQHEEQDPDGGAAHVGNGKSWWRSWLPFGGGRRASQDRATQGYRRLAMQLRFDLDSRNASDGRSIFVTTPSSPNASATRYSSQVVVELAQLLASEHHHRVLIVDGCLGHGSILTGELGGVDSPGLSDALDSMGSEFEPAEIVGFPTSIPGMHFLPRGCSRKAPMALLSRERLEGLLASVRPNYDYVLIHGPAVLEDPVALAYPSEVDAVLLLVIENETQLVDIDASQRALAEVKARWVGMVMTPRRRRWH